MSSAPPILDDGLSCFHPVTAAWFRAVFDAPTAPQRLGWPVIARGESTLILAPTGTGKTLTAFLSCLDRLMLRSREQGSGNSDQGTPAPKKENLGAPGLDFETGDETSPYAAVREGTGFSPYIKAGQKRRASAPERKPGQGCRIVYVSPLKALAVDVERNLRSPLAGIANMARRMGVPFHEPEISVRTGDTPSRERARFARQPAEILITTPESLYLILTSQAAEALRTVDTVIIDEIHALVPTKRGAHLALSLERLEALVKKPIQRIGLSATQRPLEEVARFLGGFDIGSKCNAENPSTRDKGIRGHDNESGHDFSRANETPKEDRALAPEAFALLIDNLEPITNAPALVPSPYSLVPGEAQLRPRPVTIVDASAPKQLRLRIEVPVEDMARLTALEEIPSGPASQPPRRVSIWNAIHPRLLEIVRERTSTILFVNNRQTAERLAGALNDLAGEEIARAHHGSLAAHQRSVIEDQLKAGKIRALCATSTLELGIDMGAVDLVIQIEAPPSVASGMQRIGRAGHHVNAVSEGVLFPKYRSDLIACAAVTRAMHEGAIESTRYSRNPLDVLAQQIVAIVAHPPFPQEFGVQGLGSAARSKAKRGQRSGNSSDAGCGDLSLSPSVPSPLVPQSLGPELPVDLLYDLVRRAAPFADLTRSSFEGVLDLLSGRYPSDEFAELRPRLTWDRIRNVVTARDGAARLAILNAGSIPDRGLYGVFLAHNDGKPVRVGELDEEMVFESHTNETFILGASTWRIVDITHDRVLVTPAPGEPGKMPFWKGEGAGRPLEFGRRIGALVRELRAVPKPAALTRLVAEHDLDPNAAENLLQFLADQETATGQVPDDSNIVIERVRDELGDWRVCVLTPFGRRIHTPWAMAVAARIRAAGGPDVETLWTDDGFVVRFPDTDDPPDSDWFLVESAEAMNLVLRQLGSTALFAGRFREAAGRALLLPRHYAGSRTPLWQLRKRSYDLLSVASRYPSFPLLLETYRECLRDIFDMPALVEILGEIEQRKLRVHVVNTRTPSPFASSLLFSYVANFLYDGDAPLAERRAQALTIDQDQLRELLGEADLRELLDPIAIAEVEEQIQCLTETTRARSMDGIHDLCLRLGDLSRAELQRRVADPSLLESVDRLVRARRLLDLRIGGEKRLIAAEDAARYRDALGIPLPPGLAIALLEPVAQPVLELVRRFARTHGPFTLREPAERFGLDVAAVEAALHQLAQEGRVLEGAFRPGGIHKEWCDNEILRHIRRKSLAKLRKEVEPVEQHTLARFLTHWQGLLLPRRSSLGHLDALLDAVESLQGAPIPASLFESSILPARIADYSPSGIDTLIAAGEVAWAGIEPIGERDGRIALYLADKLPLLAQPRPQTDPLTEREEKLLAVLESSGASFFDSLHQAIGGGYPGETIDALWSLVWRGLITNDSLHALRAYIARPESARAPRRVHTGMTFRSRRTTPPNAQGRWSLLPLRSISFRPSDSRTNMGAPGPDSRTWDSTKASLSGSVTGNDFSRAESGRNELGASASVREGTGFSPYMGAPGPSVGIWDSMAESTPTTTQSSHALALQLLNRYGVVLRESVAAENIPGGFSAVYGVLKALEESGRIRRGYFVTGLGATQFALPAAVDLLRQLRTESPPEKPEFVQLSATDPANPYGSVLHWPDLPVMPDDSESAPRILTRAVYAEVILRNGQLIAWLRRGNPNLLVFLPADEPERSQAASGLAHFLCSRGQERMSHDRMQSAHREGMLIATINGQPVAAHFMARFLMDAGFHAGPLGMNLRRLPPPLTPPQHSPSELQ